MEKGQPFVRHEDHILAQSEDCCKTPEEKNLVRKIDQCTSELFQSLNALEGEIDGINKELLPLQQDCTEKEDKDRKAPSGWFEKHLDFLMTLYKKSINIHGKVLRLNGATKGINKG